MSASDVIAVHRFGPCEEVWDSHKDCTAEYQRYEDGVLVVHKCDCWCHGPRPLGVKYEFKFTGWKNFK